MSDDFTVGGAAAPAAESTGGPRAGGERRLPVGRGGATRPGVPSAREDGRCGRCADAGTVRPHPPAGGSSAPPPTLCRDCRALVDPACDDGDWRAAPLFPVESADSRVAVVRRPVEEPASVRRNLRLLAADSAPTSNRAALSTATLSIGAGAAVDAGVDLPGTLRRRGVVPTGDRKRELGVRVVDGLGDPVVDATVTVAWESRTARAATGDDGRVGVLLPPGTDEARVTVSHPACDPGGMTVDLASGRLVGDRTRTEVEVRAPRRGGRGGLVVRQSGRVVGTVGAVLVAAAVVVAVAGLAAVRGGVVPGGDPRVPLATAGALALAGVVLVAGRRVTDRLT